MGSRHSGEHTAGDHLQMDITTYNIEEAQKRYRLKTVSYRLLGSSWAEQGGGALHVLLDPNRRPSLLEWFESFGTHEDFLTHQ